MASTRRRWRWTKIKRDSIFLVWGLAIITHEAFIRSEAQAELLIVGLALCGFPNLLHANELLKRALTVEEAKEEAAR